MINVMCHCVVLGELTRPGSPLHRQCVCRGHVYRQCVVNSARVMPAVKPWRMTVPLIAPQDGPVEQLQLAEGGSRLTLLAPPDGPRLPSLQHARSAHTLPRRFSRQLVIYR